MSDFDLRLPRVDRELPQHAATADESPFPAAPPRPGPSEDDGGNPLLASFAKPVELGGDVGAGEAVDYAAERFSNVSEGMDLLHASRATRGTKALGGTMGATLGLVGSGFGVYDGVEDVREGKKARGVAEMVQGGAGIVGAGAGFVETAAEGFKVPGLSSESAEFFEQKIHGANVLGSGMAAIGDGLQGAFDMADGYEAFTRGHGVDERAVGATTGVKGIAETGAGIADATLALTGTESLGSADSVGLKLLLSSAGDAASMIGPAAGAFAAGVGLGNKMESVTKDSGLLKDDQGRNENGSDRTSRWSEEIAEKIDPSRIDADGKVHRGGQSVLAQIAGGATSILSSPVGAAMDVAGTADSAYHWLKGKL